MKRTGPRYVQRGAVRPRGDSAYLLWVEHRAHLAGFLLLAAAWRVLLPAFLPDLFRSRRVGA